VEFPENATSQNADGERVVTKNSRFSNMKKKPFSSLGNLRRTLRGFSFSKSMSMQSVVSNGSTSCSSIPVDNVDNFFSDEGSTPHRCSSSSRGNNNQTGKVAVDCFENANLSYGIAQLPGCKDQDRFDIRVSAEGEFSEVNYFSIFDGHGTSAFAADVCEESLFDSVGTHTLPSDGAIVEAYDVMDRKVRENEREPRTGTCAITLFLNQEEPANLIDDFSQEIEGKVAWVGDCRCMYISQDGTVRQLTQDHRIDGNKSEEERVLNSDHSTREGLLESTVWRNEFAKAEQCGEVTFLRSHSFIGRRTHNGVATGPRCVFAHTGGVSLQVTRSIGDPYAARSVISTPEVVSFSVPRGEYARFVLGSDGLFDIFSCQDVAKFVSSYKDPSRAAKKLAVQAKQKRLYAGMSLDDITVLVIDLNPEMRKFSKRKNLFS